MPGPAQVRSVDAIEAFRLALVRFEQRAQDALETLTGEIQRADDWLRSDRPPYWKEQVRLAAEAAHEAKVDLDRCLMYPLIEGQRPSRREERDALKKAQAQLDYCREKTEVVKRWKRELHHELFEFEGRLSAMREMLETEIPQAHAKLKHITRSIDKYQIEKPPESRDPEPTLKVKEAEQ